MKPFLFTCLIFFLFTICSHINNTAGTSNETQTVVGKVTYANGGAVEGAEVTLYDQKKVTTGMGKLAKTSAMTFFRVTKTGKDGTFCFDSVSKGNYYLECIERDNLGSIIEAIVDTDTVHVDCTIKPMGAIEGVIDTGSRSNTGKTYLYIVETQQQVLVDSATGKFRTGKLPPYTYTLQVQHDTVYVKSSFDTAKIVVQEGSTTYVGNAAPVVLIGVDTTSGSAPFAVKIIYKVTDLDSDTLSMHLKFGDGTLDTILRSSGSISHIYNDSGTYKVLLIADDHKGGVGQDSVIITVTKVSPPMVTTPLLPIDGAAGHPLSTTLTWVSVTNASSYDVQVSTDNTFSLVFVEDSTLTSASKTLGGLSNNITYFWRVRAKNIGGVSNWTNTWSFTTIIAAPATPVLTTPAEGATGQSIAPVLTWSTVADAATYHIQVSTVNTFATVLIEDSTLATSTKALSGLANGTTYYWRVSAKNAGGISTWTSPLSFTTIIAAPATPVLTTPTDGATGQPLTPVLTWSTVADAATYHVQVSNVNTFATVLIEDSTLVSPAKALSGLANGITYYWRVLTKNAGGKSNWTTSNSFITAMWVTMNSGTTSNLNGIAFGNNLFVAISGDTTLTSSDGVTWTCRISGISEGLNGVGFGDNLFVAVGQPHPSGGNGAIVTSSDGITWTPRSSGTPDWIPAVTWGHNQFVAVEWWLHISTDGITWNDNYSTNNGGKDHLDGITWGNNQFIAVGRAGLIYTSPDGNIWTKQTSGSISNLKGASYGNNLYVAIGDNGTILSSPDGITWTGRTSGTSNTLNGVTYANNQFIAVGAQGIILSSPDGISWTSQSSGTTNGLTSVNYGNNRFVAVGWNGTILTLP